MRPILSLVSPLFLLSLLPAQGLHPTSGSSLLGLRTTHLQVRGEIQDQIATTELVQTIHNDTQRNREALWLLPLPEGATADGFTMTVNGTEMVGEVLDGASARRIYQDIVRRKRDPGLLEYAGRGALRARIFPIPPKGKVEVVVRYRQVLPETGGLHLWSFPIRSAAVGSLFATNITVDLRIRSSKPIRNIFSPLPGVEVLRQGENNAHVSFETSTMPERDLEVYFGLEDREFGLNLLTWRRGEKPGYFAMILSPKRDWPETTMRRSIQFVVDTSGSMSGRKIAQAKQALGFFLDSLNPRDRFNIVTFATEAVSLFSATVDAVDDNLVIARERVDKIRASGGTNIFAALEKTLTRGATDEEYLPVTVFLTDGRPTIGTTNEDIILALVESENRQDQRIFVFGVGNDLNTRLLDRIAEGTRGSRDYVREDEAIEVKTGALFTRLSHPVLTDLVIDCDPMDGFAIHPGRLPDLFKGDRLVVLGRYRNPGRHTIRLRGNVQGQAQEYEYRARFVSESTRHDFVPPLWAERRVAMLLDNIRLHGQDQELLNEIRRLGTEFGIVTPYTSHLILEEADRIRLAEAADIRGAGSGPGGPTTQGGRVFTGSSDFFMGGGRRRVSRGPGDTTPPARGRGGGPAGPGSPGPAGSAAAGPKGPTTGRGGIILTPELTLEQMLRDLQKVGALPADASVEQLRAMARRLGAELAGSAGRLSRLREENSGAEAVDTSLYLLDLARAGTASGQSYLGIGRRAGSSAALIEKLTRRIAGRTFVLRSGVWTDTAYEEGKKEGLVRVAAFSEAYFALLDSVPELAPYFAFSNYLRVVLDSQVYEVFGES